MRSVAIEILRVFTDLYQKFRIVGTKCFENGASHDSIEPLTRELTELPLQGIIINIFNHSRAVPVRETTRSREDGMYATFQA
jgi:hypothetical protein